MRAPLNILVAVKQVPDPAALVSITPDGQGLDFHGARMVLNPFDEIALEAAVQLKEAGHAARVDVVTVGPVAWCEGLRTALALGADHAWLVEAPEGEGMASSDGVALVLRAFVAHLEAIRQPVGLILMGKQAVDSDAGQTGPRLAALLGWPQATFVAALHFESGTPHQPAELHVTREVDGGLEMLALSLPAVITADLRLNTPRYPSLPNILKAKRKPLDQLVLHDLLPGWADAGPSVQVIGWTLPPARPPGIRVDSAVSLLEQLRRMEILPK